MSGNRRVSRRRFLRDAGATAAATGAVALLPAGCSTTPSPGPAIPSPLPHRALDVPGVHAYPLEHSIAAGETLELCVSTTVPYRLSICRLGRDVDHPAGDEVLAELGSFPANPQPIHPGSYVACARGIEGPLRALTLECWVRPWDLKSLQGVITQEDKEADDGFALGIGPDGYVGFFLGDGVSPDEKVIHRTAAGALKRNVWHHLVATWDGATKRVHVNGREAGAWRFTGPLVTGRHPLRLGEIGRASCRERVSVVV